MVTTLKLAEIWFIRTKKKVMDRAGTDRETVNEATEILYVTCDKKMMSC